MKKYLSIFVVLASFLTSFANAETSTHKFVPYKDITLNANWQTNPPQATDLVGLSSTSGAKAFTLAFIVSANNSCSAAWGGYDAFSLKSGFGVNEVQNFVARGGEITISFGGANGTDLSVVCGTEQLAQIYNQVIDMYKPTRLDFDIEGALIQNHQAIDKMLTAIDMVTRHSTNPVEISFTLPALPQGLTPEGVAVLNKLAQKQVNFKGINIMAMDYGTYAAPNPAAMGQYAIDAATATQKQIRAAFPMKNEADAWGMVEVTPMIGVNDVWHYDRNPAEPEFFTVEDAENLVKFAKEKGLGRVSMWSIDRDKRCDQKYASPSCSGMKMVNDQAVYAQGADYEFSKVLSKY